METPTIIDNGTTADASALRRRLRELERSRSEEGKRIATLTNEKAEFRAQWSNLGQYLLERADANDLCEVFDNEIESWNAGCKPEYKLPTRSVDVAESITIDVNATVSRERASQVSHAELEYVVIQAIRHHLQEHDADNIDVC